jgi:uncharacterized protein
VESRRPELAAEVFDHPYFDVWFRQPDAAVYLAGLVAGAGTRAGVTFELSAPSAGPDLMIPGVGLAVGLGPGPVRFVGDGRTLTLAGSGARLVASPTKTAAWTPMHRIQMAGERLEWTVLLDELDPYRDRFATPPGPRLAANDRGRFVSLLEAAWRLLVDRQADHAEAMRALIRVIVPVQPAGQDQVSASARDAAGAVAVSPPVDAVTMAELLVHELQHVKLGALLDLVELVRPGGPARYYAPWRPDPRAAGPLLNGAYAYVAVTGFWRACGDAYRFAYWRAHVAHALQQLAGSGELTPLGERFVAGLRATVRHWLAEPVGGDAARRAARAVATDRAAWRATQFGSARFLDVAASEGGSDAVEGRAVRQRRG